MYISEGLPNNRPPETFIYKLRLFKLIWQLVNNRNLSAKTIKYYNDIYSNDLLWESNKKSLHEFIKLCKNYNIRCYISILPLLYQLNENYPFLNIHQKIENAIYRRCEVIDLLPDFIGRTDVDLWVHPTDQHPNEVAHGLIASKISKVILKTFQQGAAADHASHGN